MNTISITQKLHSLLADFEQQSGHTIPSVMPVVDLYRDYCDWARRNHEPVENVTTFFLRLTQEKGCMPCRLPDGSVGVIGIAPKAMLAAGVLQ